MHNRPSYLTMLTGLVILFGAACSCALEGDSLWSQNYSLPHQWTSFYDWSPGFSQDYTILGRAFDSVGGGSDYWLFNINQQGSINWSQMYNNLSLDLPVTLLTVDSGYVLAGTSSNLPNLSYIWAIRTDTQGDCLWSHNYCSPEQNILVKILPCDDGGFLFGCNNWNQDSGYNMRLFRLDSAGDTLWTRSFESPYIPPWEELKDIAPVGTDGWLLLGWFNDVGLSIPAIVLIRLNDQGDTLWTRTFGYSNSNEVPISMLSTPDGGYLLNCVNYGPNSSNAWLIKVNDQGDSIWSRSFGQGGYGAEWFETILMTAEGDFLAAGQIDPAGLQDPGNVWLMKISSAGDSLWSRALGQDSLYESFLKIIPTSDNEYLMAIWRFSTLNPDTSSMLWLVKINDQGDTLWSRSFQADGELENGAGLLQGSDGNYRVIRGTNATEQLPAFLNLLCIEGPTNGVAPDPTITPVRFSLHPCSPNPFNPTTSISYELPAASFVTLRVYDIAGHLVTTLIEGREEPGPHRATFDGSGLASGIYLAKLQAGTFTQTQKLVLLK
jgi:hypothetical protein